MRLKHLAHEDLDNCICSHLGHQFSEFIEVDILDDKDLFY